jgi:hypothetical protein
MLRDSVTNRTGPVNGKLAKDFIIIGEELRVGQVIFLQDHCEGPVADQPHQAQPRCCGVNSVQTKCLKLKIQPRQGT